MGISISLKNAIQDYRNGDNEAFTIIYNESEKYIYSSIYRVVKGNYDAIDMTADVMGDTYLEISQRFEQLKDDEKFFSWAGTIATRKCYAYIKKNKREVLLSEDDATFEQLADDDNIIPEEVMQSREAQRLLKEIIDRELNEMQKLCIVGVYYNEQKQSEIAKELGIPENTVKTHLSRAKAKIKAGVEELNIKKDTKLFSVVSFLLLLFKEDVQACEVPAQISTKVLGAVGASAGTINAGAVGSISQGSATGIKGFIGKVAGASTKAKMMGALATGVVAAGCAGTFMFMNQHQEVTWESLCKKYITENQEIVGFDLNDFDGDGVPEIVVNINDNKLRIMKYDDGVFRSIESEQIGFKEQSELNEPIKSKEVIYGYGSDFNEMIYLDKEIFVCGNEEILVPRIVDKHYKDRDDVEVLSYLENLIMTTNSETGEFEYNSSNFSCWINNEDTGKEYTFAEWFKEADTIMKQFNPIEFAGVTENEIDERIAEYEQNGNRKRSNVGLDWHKYDERDVLESVVVDDDLEGDYDVTGNSVDLSAICDDYHNQFGGDELYRFIHDFDKDGKEEAFLILGEYSSEGSHTVSDLLYFNSAGEITVIPVTDRGNSNIFYGYIAGDKIMETESRDYIVWEKDAFGSGSTSYIFSVRNGECFEPEISGEYMSFGLQSDGSIKGWQSDFSAGFHDYIETEFIIDTETGEFLKK